MDANGENKKVKKKAEEEFLHIIDVNKVLCETGLDLDGLCKLVKLDSQTINRWGCKKSKNGNRPKYNAAIRLLRAGATVETLYGVEYKRPSPPPTTEKSQDQITPTDLSWAFGEAMKLLQEKKAKELNSEEKK
jgi:hypothetical protein